MLTWTLKQLREYFKSKANWAKKIYIGNPPKGLVEASSMPAIILEPQTTRLETNDNQREILYYDIIVWLVLDERKSRNPNKQDENNALTDVTEYMEGGDKRSVDFGDDSIVAILLDKKQDGVGQNWWVWEVGNVDYGVAERGGIHTREAQIMVTVAKLKTRNIT